MLGTDRFAAPELWHNAHDADFRADFYGLGRVVAWLLGCTLVPNVPALPPGDWAPFVSALTAMSVDDRPRTHEDVRHLIPQPQSIPRTVVVGEDQQRAPDLDEERRTSQLSLEDIVEGSLDEYVSDLVNNDDLITSLIAGTNASGYYADEIEVLSAGPLDLATVTIPFTASIHLSGEQDPDSMFAGDAITAMIHGQLEHNGNEWIVAQCDVRDAAVDDYSE